jgi:hypothetical protein
MSVVLAAFAGYKPKGEFGNSNGSERVDMKAIMEMVKAAGGSIRG